MIEFAVESLETPALTKAQLADLLFDQIGLFAAQYVRAALQRGFDVAEGQFDFPALAIELG